MGIYRFGDDPLRPGKGRAGLDVAEYEGWAIANIINKFMAEHDLTVEYNRMMFRRAMLVSKEFEMAAKRGKFNV